MIIIARLNILNVHFPNKYSMLVWKIPKYQPNESDAQELWFELSYLGFQRLKP